eukprot:gene674-11985_t
MSFEIPVFPERCLDNFKNHTWPMAGRDVQEILVTVDTAGNGASAEALCLWFIHP